MSLFAPAGFFYRQGAKDAKVAKEKQFAFFSSLATFAHLAPWR